MTESDREREGERERQRDRETDRDEENSRGEFPNGTPRVSSKREHLRALSSQRIIYSNTSTLQEKETTDYCPQNLTTPSQGASEVLRILE